VRNASYIIGINTKEVIIYGLFVFPNIINRRMIIDAIGSVLIITIIGLIKLSKFSYLYENKDKVIAVRNDITIVINNLKIVLKIIEYVSLEDNIFINEYNTSDIVGTILELLIVLLNKIHITKIKIIPKNIYL